MHKKLYDSLRIAQIVIPALGTLYAALAKAWGWDFSAEVMATCGAITAFIGVLLTIESRVYFNKHIVRPVEMTKEEVDAILEGEE